MQSLRREVKDFCRHVIRLGGDPYIVGGYVRDSLLGREPKDVDIVLVNANRNVIHFLDKCGECVGKSFPVWKVGTFEVALARRERKAGRGYRGFISETDGVSLRDDLFRRDLTINAIALDPVNMQIFDPFHGSDDLNNKILRPVGKHFGEDPVRILRAARFCAELGMSISGELIEAAQPALKELASEPGKRAWNELSRSLNAPKPSIFIDALDRMGALEIVLPEIHALKGRIQPEKYHPEGDAYVHTLEVIDRAAEMGCDNVTMFAALVHDLGKAVTPDDQLPHHYNHEALGVPLVRQMGIRLRIPREYIETGIVTAREHLNVHRFLELRAVKKVRLLVRLGVIHSDLKATRVVLASKADARGRGGTFAQVAYEQGDKLLEAAQVIRQVKGDQFANIKDPIKLAQKLEQARVKALAEAGF